MTDQLPGRAPKYDLDAEQGLLGSILLNSDGFSVFNQTIKGNHLVFSHETHQTIYQAILEVVKTNATLDIISVHAKHNELFGVHDNFLSYLSSLQDKTPSSSALDYFAKIVIERFVTRTLYDKLQAVLTGLDAGVSNADSVTALLSIPADVMIGYQQQPDIGSLANSAHDRIFEDRSNLIRTGIRDLDSVLRGVEDEFVVIGARPSLGKSSFGVTIASNIADSLKDGRHVGIITLETPSDRLVQRMMEVRSGLSTRDVELFDDHEHRQLAAAHAGMKRLPIVMHYNPRMTIHDIAGVVAEWHRKGKKLAAVIVDQLSLVASTNPRHDKGESISEASALFRKLPKDYGCPFFVLHQLNREAEGERPSIKNLSRAGEVEQDADLIMLLWQPTAEFGRSIQTAVDTEIVVAKRRYGGTGRVPAVFKRFCGRWEGQPIGVPDDQQQPKLI